MIQVGDRVRILMVPPQVEATPDETDDLHTKELFRHCVGRTFPVQDIDEYGHLELWVYGWGDTPPDIPHFIWIEPEYVEVVAAHDTP
jgi:hypothetical protein